MTALGVPVEGRTTMITAWLPSLMRHKHIVYSPSLPASCDEELVLTLTRQGYRLLSPAQLEPSIAMTMIPPPDVVVRIFVRPTLPWCRIEQG